MDFQFYPTPRHLSKLVWAKFKNPIELVLDPEAGKGDLTFSYILGFKDEDTSDVRHSYRHKGWYYENHIKWHACEINPEMHSILTERGARVVGYDFLQMQSAAQYSHIVGNPPFNAGASHVLHAWDIAYGAELCFILNAETIRNPYSIERKRLVELIEKYGNVEFLSDQFIGEGVERETGVEIAIVYLEKIPNAVLNIDNVVDSLKPAKEVKVDGGAALNALALPKDFIDRVVEDYQITLEASIRFAEAKAVLSMAQNRLGRTFAEMQSKGLNAVDRPEQVNPQTIMRESIEQLAEDTRERAWAQVLRSTKLQDTLSTAGRKDVESQFNIIAKLEFSKTNIHGFFAGVLQSMGDINKTMILDLFDSIMQRDNDNAAFFQSWKSNEKHKTLGMRIKRTRFILPLTRYEGRSSSASYAMLNVLADIDKVFRMLDGKSTVPVKNENGFVFDNGLRNCFNNAHRFDNLVNGSREETEYFDVRYYPGKGTVHFFPKNMEVIERLNRYVGRARQWIPEDMESANADFIKQYEEAEKLTPDYLQEFRRVDRDARSPVYTMLKTKEHDDSDIAFLTRIGTAVSKVQLDNGINVNNQLTSAPSAGQHEQLALTM